MPVPRDPPAHLDVFRALGHPVRRAIVECLVEGDVTAGQLVEYLWDHFRLLTSSTSKHLRVLREAGIVVSTVRTQHRIYSLRPRGLEELAAWSARYAHGLVVSTGPLPRDRAGRPRRAQDAPP